MGIRLQGGVEWGLLWGTRHVCLGCQTFAWDVSLLLKQGWCRLNSEAKPHAVATLQANAWGFHDMHGNVAEWCMDPVGTTRDERFPRRVCRGGTWNYGPLECRSGHAVTVEPTKRLAWLGFRVLLEDPSPFTIPANGPKR